MSDWARGPTGRRRIWPSPVNTAAPVSRREADPIDSLSVVPEFRTSITLSGGVGLPPKPRTRQEPVCTSISAPIARYASIAARVSADSSGASIRLSPSANAAMHTARIVWDFEPGMSTEPANREGLTMSCMILLPPEQRGFTLRAAIDVGGGGEKSQSEIVFAAFAGHLTDRPRKSSKQVYRSMV